MGQTHSEEPRLRSREDLANELARKLASNCFTSLELLSLTDVFRSLADARGPVRYLPEDTLARFLELPDILGAGPVVFRLASYLAAFPFLRDAPAVLGLEQLLVVVVLLTGRHAKVLRRPARNRLRLLWGGLAVHDRKLVEEEEKMMKRKKKKSNIRDYRDDDGDGNSNNFDDNNDNDDNDDDDDDDADDDLVLSTFELLNIDDAFRHGDAPATSGAMIPGDNFRSLIMLLLLAAPLDPQENLSRYSAQVAAGNGLEALGAAADAVLAAFLDVERSAGVKFRHFQAVIPAVAPHMFIGLENLFEHFLFSKKLDFTKHRPPPQTHPTPGEQASALNAAVTHAPLPSSHMEISEIMSHAVVSQLSFFLPGASLFGRLRPLYSGNQDGFSMGSFETKTFNWRAPTILLVRGTRIADPPSPGLEAAFVASVPARRFPPGNHGSDRLTFGVYVPEPWRHTSRECFGGDGTVLFQLEPVHDVFHASAVNTDRVSFTRPPNAHPPALAVGAPHPSQKRRITSGSSSLMPAELLPLGAVSLVLDGSFEFGVFNHDHTSHGGAFSDSVSRKLDFQDRFAVESLEVWGCGGDAEAREQEERWAWERREAESRRRINLGTGDVDADRALLEMAGLIGGNRSGGSMM